MASGVVDRPLLPPYMLRREGGRGMELAEPRRRVDAGGIASRSEVSARPAMGKQSALSVTLSSSSSAVTPAAGPPLRCFASLTQHVAEA